MYEMEIPIIIDKDLVIYEYEFFARGFHVYMDIWVGHIPHNISKFSSMFLTIPSTAIEVEVLGKRVNRGSGYGLEIPVKY